MSHSARLRLAAWRPAGQKKCCPPNCVRRVLPSLAGSPFARLAGVTRSPGIVSQYMEGDPSCASQFSRSAHRSVRHPLPPKVFVALTLRTAAKPKRMSSPRIAMTTARTVRRLLDAGQDADSRRRSEPQPRRPRRPIRFAGQPPRSAVTFSVLPKNNTSGASGAALATRLRLTQARHVLKKHWALNAATGLCESRLAYLSSASADPVSAGPRLAARHESETPVPAPHQRTPCP